MKILVIGGYGNFGKRLVHSLLCHYDHEIIIAGRSLSKACAFIECCRRETGKTPAIARLDVVDSDLTRAAAGKRVKPPQSPGSTSLTRI
jgi:saccharopine dehydrogenase-like NADP-dependent oxidoreductase